jgi:PqqD family protein of HPr-rel-A system
MRPDAISWHEWDDGLVVYNDATGDTHHLSALGSEVMLALLRHPFGIDTTSLVSELSEQFEAAEGLALSVEVKLTLDSLAELQLATSVSE